jgi:hypothetical protein
VKGVNAAPNAYKPKLREGEMGGGVRSTMPGGGGRGGPGGVGMTRGGGGVAPAAGQVAQWMTHGEKGVWRVGRASSRMRAGFFGPT